ncbi:MAG: hypothetical protein ABFS45_22460 [Pseudomonadota bacterium]
MNLPIYLLSMPLIYLSVSAFASKPPPSGPQEVVVVNEESAPVPVSIVDSQVTASSLVYRFAGFSTQTTTGNVGINNLYKICQYDLGNDAARMCSSKEFMLSPSVASITADSLTSWVHPTIIGSFGVQSFIDYTGVDFVYPSFTSCNGWIGGDRGLAVFVIGGAVAFGPLPCVDALQVTCCTPQ